MVLTAYNALSPGTGLSCPVISRKTSARLDISVGISGPHVFAVRGNALSSEARLASIASRTQRRDDAQRPSGWARDRGRYSGDLRFGKTEIFLPRGLDKEKTTVEQALGDLPVEANVASSIPVAQNWKRVPRMLRSARLSRGARWDSGQPWDSACPGRGAAFLTLLRRAGTHQCFHHAAVGPGSAAHHTAKAARCAASGARDVRARAT